MNKDESQHNWRDNDESSRVSSILEWTLSVDEQRRTTAERIICEMETRGDFYLTLMVKNREKDLSPRFHFLN